MLTKTDILEKVREIQKTIDDGQYQQVQHFQIMVKVQGQLIALEAALEQEIHG